MKKIDVEKSLIYRFDSLSELTKCVFLLGEKGYFSDYKNTRNTKRFVSPHLRRNPIQVEAFI